MIDVKLLQYLSNELIKCDQREYYNKPGIRQSSVAIIFEYQIDDISQFEEFPLQKKTLVQNSFFEFILTLKQREMRALFLQRAINPKDFHSGQICFPGGKLNDGENDYDAAIRETYEETGIDLANINKGQTFYLGRLPTNVYVRVLKSKQILFACAHVFLILYQNEIKLNLNETECHSYKWVPFSLFYTNVKDRVQDAELMKYGAKSSLQQYLPTYLNYFLAKKIEKNGYGVQAYQYNIDFQNNVPLWGLTFYLFSQMISVILYSHHQKKNQDILEVIVELKRLCEACAHFQVNFNGLYGIGWLISSQFEKNYRKKRIYSVNYKNILANSKL